MLVLDRDRRRRFRLQARQLANTGKFRSWQEIEGALVRAGRPGVERALQAPVFRIMLDVRCALARSQAEKALR